MLNNFTLMGRFTKDPELRRTKENVACCSFTLACDRDSVGKDGVRETDFFDCVAWRKTGEHVSRNFKKGQLATVKGRVEFRKWTDRSGNARRNAEVVVDEIYFADSKR